MLLTVQSGESQTKTFSWPSSYSSTLPTMTMRTQENGFYSANTIKQAVQGKLASMLMLYIYKAGNIILQGVIKDCSLYTKAVESAVLGQVVVSLDVIVLLCPEVKL